jgi:single-stranded-DNA-specific exonuclease
VRNGEPVIAYGDFDVDGVTSAATIVETLTDLGGVADAYIPQRKSEGYGLNIGAIDRLASQGTRVIVTCDCGTSSRREVAYAADRGIDVIIVDHHLPPAELPPATALVNPKLAGSRYPFSDHSTAGLAYRLAEALYDAFGRPFPAERYLDLAALGTVADMVPLLGENRQLVSRGLAALTRTERPGLRALLQVADIATGKLSSETIAFALAPRLNAAGRLADARLAFELLTTRDEERALALATQIDGLNRERQQLTREAELIARDLVTDPDLPVTIVGHERFHQGVIGLVASRLVEQLGRPAVVYEQGQQESRASCRSIGAYDITGGLRSCADLFERYGGHHQAAGFTIRSDRLPELQARLTQHAATALAGVELAPSLQVDAEWPLAALKTQEIRWLGKLGPFGVANSDPVLVSRGVIAAESSLVGEERRHLRLKLRDGPVIWPAISFGWEDEAPAAGTRLDVVYTLASDRFGPTGGGGALQLRVLDLAAASE